MKIVGLVSGGKDSCYGLVRCVASGHSLVAIANLAPADRAHDEKDSHMFQTIGHNIIRDLADCIGVPLYTCGLEGSSVRTELQYHSTDGDEVEDMYELLARVQREHPDLGGVCSGAILSSYQRIRVEHVCSRLNLTSLAPLWQRDQAELLDEMLAGGVRAVLLKVASMGLIPRLHLGKELGMLQPHLTRLGRDYGVHVCGEGGEYETLTLDCPLFRKRLHLDATQMVGDLRTDIAPVAVLRLEQWHTEDKGADFDPIAACKATTRTGRSVGYEEEEEEAGDEGAADWRKLQAATVASAAAAAVSTPATPACAVTIASFDSSLSVPEFPPVNVVGEFCFVATATAPSSSIADAAAAPPAIGAALTQCVAHIESVLKAAGFTLADILYVQLFLPQLLAQFAQANAAYKNLFSLVNAPSRACVQLAAAAPATGAISAAAATSAAAPLAILSVDCVASRVEREVLHVQSISDWAPACIGPYSQASKLPPLLWLAGQIGMEAGTMALAPDVRVQCALALRHCAQVLRALGSDWAHATSVVLFWQAAFWRTQFAQSFIRAVLLPMLARRLRGGAAAAGGNEASDWRIADRAVVHVVVPTLPRDALLEVQLLAAPLSPALPLAALQLPASDGTPGVNCHAHVSYAPASFSSVWAALTLPLAHGVAAPAAAVDPADACERLLSRVEEAMRKSNVAADSATVEGGGAASPAPWSWAHVLLFRVYLSPHLCERDARIGLHRALSARELPRLPAISFLLVEDVQLHGICHTQDAQASTLLAAHLLLLPASL